MRCSTGFANCTTTNRRFFFYLIEVAVSEDSD
jgi:hypothetical protein